MAEPFPGDLVMGCTGEGVELMETDESGLPAEVDGLERLLLKHKGEMIPAPSPAAKIEDHILMATAVQPEGNIVAVCALHMLDVVLPMVSCKCSEPSVSAQIDGMRTLIPSVGVESTPIVAASALTAPVLLTDRIVAPGNQELAMQLGAGKVFEKLPMNRDTTAVVIEKPLHVAVQEVEDCNCEGIVQKESEDVLTHVGGASLFLEFVMDTPYQVLDAKLPKDELRSDARFTQFAALHTQCHNQQCKVPFFLVAFETWAGDPMHHGSDSLMVCDAEKGGHANDLIRRMGYSADKSYGTAKKRLKLIHSFAELWDPGILRIVSSSCQLKTVRTQTALAKLQPWRRSGFSPGDTMQPRQYKCGDLCSFIYSGWYVQSKQWYPGVGNSTDVTELSTPETGGCISAWRNRFDLELNDSVDNTTLFCHEIGVPVSAYGRAIVILELAHYTNCKTSVHMVGHMMLELTESVDVLLDGREDAVWDHVLAGILLWRRNALRIGNDKHLNIMDASNGDLLRIGNDKHLNIMDASNGDLLLQRHGAWSDIRAEQRIKSTKLVEAQFVLKVKLRSWSATKDATPYSCFLTNQMEYMVQALFVYCFSPTWPPDRYISEAVVSSMVSIKAKGGNSLSTSWETCRFPRAIQWPDFLLIDLSDKQSLVQAMGS